MDLLFFLVKDYFLLQKIFGCFSTPQRLKRTLLMVLKLVSKYFERPRNFFAFQKSFLTNALGQQKKKIGKCISATLSTLRSSSTFFLSSYEFQNCILPEKEKGILSNRSLKRPQMVCSIFLQGPLTFSRLSKHVGHEHSLALDLISHLYFEQYFNTGTYFRSQES